MASSQGPPPSGGRRADSRGRSGGDRRENVSRSQRRPLSVSEVQDLLREKMCGNLRAVRRMFRLFDLDRSGLVHKPDLQRILDHHGVALRDRDFSRFWRAQSPGSAVSYEALLESLGFEKQIHMAPVCSRIDVSSPGSKRSLQSGRGSEPPSGRGAGFNLQTEQLHGSPRSAWSLPPGARPLVESEPGGKSPTPGNDTAAPPPDEAGGGVTRIHKKRPVNVEENSSTLFKHLSFCAGPEQRHLLHTRLMGSSERSAAQKKQALEAVTITIKDSEDGRRLVDVQSFRAERRSLEVSCRDQELHRLLQEIQKIHVTSAAGGQERRTSAPLRRSDPGPDQNQNQSGLNPEPGAPGDAEAEESGSEMNSANVPQSESRPGTGSGGGDWSFSAAAAERHSDQDLRPRTAGALLTRSEFSRPAVSRPKTGLDLDQEQRGLIRALRRNWRNILKNCSDADSERRGRVSTDAFIEILEALGRRASEEQLTSLQPDAVRRGQVCYHLLLQRCLLDPRPDSRGTRLRLPQQSRSPVPPGPDVAEVMLRIYPAVRSCWTPLRRDFLSADPLLQRGGAVSADVFKKVLSGRGVVLSQDDWFHLLSHFDPSASGSVCYDSFLWAFVR